MRLTASSLPPCSPRPLSYQSGRPAIDRRCRSVAESNCPPRLAENGFGAPSVYISAITTEPAEIERTAPGHAVAPDTTSPSESTDRAPRWLPPGRALAAVWLLAAVWGALFSILSIARHRAFYTGRFDFGNMVQAVWSTAQGQPLDTTEVSGEQIIRLGAHVDPILVAFAPLWRIWPSAEMLLASQAAIVATGAVPAYLLARRWLGDERLGLAFAAVYLLYLPLQYAVLFDFHPVTLAAPLLLWAIWAAETERIWAFVAFGALAALTQEQVGLAVAVLAVWAAVRHTRIRRGASAAALGAVAWVAVAVFAILPAASVEGANPHGVRYEPLGSSESEVLTTAITRPWEVAEVLATPGRGAYLAALFLPLLLLPLLAPFLLLAAVPQFGVNLLAASGPPQSIEFHYTVVLIPILIAAAALGLSRLRARGLPGVPGRLLRSATALAATLVVVGFVAAFIAGPLSPIPGSGSPHHGFTGDAETRAMQEAVDLIPEGVPVSASNPVGAHLSDRERIHLFPLVADAEWVVVSRPGRSGRAVTDRQGTLRPGLHLRTLGAMIRSPAWERVYTKQGVHVFRKAGPAPVEARSGADA